VSPTHMAKARRKDPPANPATRIQRPLQLLPQHDEWKFMLSRRKWRPRRDSHEVLQRLQMRAHQNPGKIRTHSRTRSLHRYQARLCTRSFTLVRSIFPPSVGGRHANIAGITPLVRGMEAPPLFNQPRALDINSIPFGELDTLPEFI
jgi:hypothetical protein